MKTTISLLALCLLGYVSAGDMDDSECTEYLKLTPPEDSAGNLMAFKGTYFMGTNEMSDGQPIYRHEEDPTRCIYTDTEKGDVNLGICLTETKTYKYYLSPSPAQKTCFEPSMDRSFPAKNVVGDTDVGSVQLTSLDTQGYLAVSIRSFCSECREILSGDLKGNYTLLDNYSPYCKDMDPLTDGCVYENVETKATVCFKEDAAGQDTMPHDETCA